jgi:hypothetical protein
MVANSLKSMIESYDKEKSGESSDKEKSEESSDKEKSEELKSIISILTLSYNKEQLESIKKNIDKLDEIRVIPGYYENYTLWMPMQSEIETAVTNSNAKFPLYITGCIFKGVATKQKSDYKISNEKPYMQMKDPITPIGDTKIDDTVKLMNGCMQTFKNTKALLELSKIFGGIQSNSYESISKNEEYKKLDTDGKAEFVFVISKQEQVYDIKLFISC